MKKDLTNKPVSGSLLTRLIDAPDLVQQVRQLPEQAFASLVRHIGVEDAGELIAFATTEQLVAAFDEDVFTNERPGERETLDSERLAIWLEVLLEAGEHQAAKRLTEFSDDFVVHALSTLLIVLDQSTLETRFDEQSQSRMRAEKALESSLLEELDGYVLISRRDEAFDTVLNLVLALDRNHRAYLCRILDRCVEMSSALLDDLDEFADVLSSDRSLAEDVEGDREDRRKEKGFVEPRAARAFLIHAREPIAQDLSRVERDAITRAHLGVVRDPPRSHVATARRQPWLAASSMVTSSWRPQKTPELSELLWAAQQEGASESSSPLPLPLPLPLRRDEAPHRGESPSIVLALRVLAEHEPGVFDQRMEELVYLANVLMAGASTEAGRLRAAEAAEAALATVGYGAEIEARRRGGPQSSVAPSTTSTMAAATPAELSEVLRSHPADLLFRRATNALVSIENPATRAGFIRTHQDASALLLMFPSDFTSSCSRT